MPFGLGRFCFRALRLGVSGSQRCSAQEQRQPSVARAFPMGAVDEVVEPPLAHDVRADVLETLKASGEWWRLRRLFREQLEDCGWRDAVKRRFRRLVREAEQRAGAAATLAEDSSSPQAQGPFLLSQLDLDELIDKATSQIFLAIPESVQEALLCSVRESVCAAVGELETSSAPPSV